MIWTELCFACKNAFHFFLQKHFTFLGAMALFCVQWKASFSSTLPRLQLTNIKSLCKMPRMKTVLGVTTRMGFFLFAAIITGCVAGSYFARTRELYLYRRCVDEFHETKLVLWETLVDNNEPPEMVENIMELFVMEYNCPEPTTHWIFMYNGEYTMAVSLVVCMMMCAYGIFLVSTMYDEAEQQCTPMPDSSEKDLPDNEKSDKEDVHPKRE